MEEDVSTLPEEAVAARVTEMLGAPFDLERGPLFRAHLLRLGATEHVLLYGSHHTVLDGWSVGLLMQEMSVLYRLAKGAQGSLPSLLIQYADYAAWQRATLSGRKRSTTVRR